VAGWAAASAVESGWASVLGWGSVLGWASVKELAWVKESVLAVVSGWVLATE
jgi:hypothetical protein